MTNARAHNGYEMRALTDRFGRVTTLAYNDKHLLTRVTDSVGRQLTLRYQNISFQSGRWRNLGVVAKAPEAGQWVEFTVPAEWSKTVFQYLRVLGRSGQPLNIAEAQFFAPGSTVSLSGTAKGTGDSPAAAFDNDTTTVFQGQRGSGNLCTLDLGVSGSSLVARVRVLAPPGQESALVGVSLQGMLASPDSASVLAQMTASDGRSVSYAYETTMDPYAPHENVAMTRVSYGDGTQSTYRYAYSSANQQPLLTEADDPRYDGPAKRIRYAYHDNETLGMIHHEINPVTGGVYASLELDKADPDKRVVNYSDLRSVSYRLSKAANNRPVERVDGLGRKTTFEYEAGGAGRLAAHTYHLGRRSTFNYDATGHVTTDQRDAKVRAKHSYDQKGNRLTTTDENNRQTSYERDARGLVTRVHQPDGTVRDFTYDSVGRVTSFRQAGGKLHAFAYDAQGHRTSWTNARGGVTHYTYDAAGRVASVTDPLGHTSKRESDERGLVTKLVRPDGTTHQFAYDAYGRKISETDEHSRTTRTTYDELGRITKQEDAVGHVTVLDYTQLPGAQGCGSCVLVDKPSRIISADGRVTQNLYDAESRLLARTANAGTPAQATSDYTYDGDNNLSAMTDPLGRVTRRTYDNEHRLLSTTDAEGHTTLYAYDDHGNLVSTTTPDGAVTTSSYDAQNHRIQTTDALGQITRFGYDAAGNMITLTDASGAVTRFTYDGKKRTATLYVDGKRETVEYDLIGRVVKTTSRDGVITTTTYDSLSRVLATSDSTGRTTTNTYDPLGHRLTSIDPLNRVTAWSYDAHGNVLTTTRPDGKATTNAYDAQDRLIAATDAAGQTTHYAYDTANNLVSLTDANSHTYRFTFDGAHRKTAQIYPDGSQETWSYDAAGQLASYLNRAGQSKGLTYGNAGEPLSETWNQPGVGLDLVRAYDAAGRLASLSSIQTVGGLADPVVLTYDYDKLGRLRSETSDLSGIVRTLDASTVGYRCGASR